VNLSARGLPLRKQHGTYYRAWLKNRAGNLVPIGTFNQLTSVTMWSGVSPQKGITTLTITRQRASLLPTGRADRRGAPGALTGRHGAF
jgi:hypothetical protein